MTTIRVSAFEEALDIIDRLPVEDQEALVDIVHKRLVDQRRREIAANAQATLQAFHEGRASYGTVDDLRRELSE